MTFTTLFNTYMQYHESRISILTTSLASTSALDHFIHLYVLPLQHLYVLPLQYFNHCNDFLAVGHFYHIFAFDIFI